MYEDHDKARLLAVEDAATRLPIAGQTQASGIEQAARPPFTRDYDRLIHTAAFRRLQGKTQVVTPGQSDFFHTRLTHTVEVAQIARRLAYRLCYEADETHAREVSDVCEAAAIMHDFGHPPFGHIGEEALHQALKSVAKEPKWNVDFTHLGGYEGNAQSFRQVVWSFQRAQEDGPGLQLTRAVLDASIKYPWTFKKGKRKWNYYPSEKWAFDWVRGEAPTEDKSFEAQIMDWADDVAYATHDLEDWCHAQYIPLAMLSQSDSALEYLKQEIINSWAPTGRIVNSEARPENLPTAVGLLSTEDEVDSALRTMFRNSQMFKGFQKLGTEYDGSRDAKLAVQHMRHYLFETFLGSVVSTTGDVLRGRHAAKLHIPPEVRRQNAILKE
ncbi:dGTP triphosphohydrolase [Actinocrispum sp. NPDC049592]|uniref:deoxyguanosinetriphosphate triphosphohydrolase family protein n=1 Tax=Actinocrispum sp. NPDC049592 TaxID=3154835 RepID=UPI00342045C0